MTRKKEKKWKRDYSEVLPEIPVSNNDIIKREKERARKLRNSSWWKRKCSSGRCSYCNTEVSPNELTMDHIIPLSRGGFSEKYNIVPACKDCNSKKKYLIPAEWDEYLEMIKNKSE